MSLFFGYEPADGVLGLSPSNYINNMIPVWNNPLNTILTPFDNKIFTFVLKEKQTRGFSGEITFGSVDETLCQKGYKSTKVVGQGWTVNFEKLTLAATKFEVNVKATFDFSSSFITLPSNIVNQIYKKIEVKHGSIWGYVVDCDKIDKYPNLEMEFDGVTLVLPPRSYLVDVSSIL